jgi:iron complex outermembrane receptor protein
VLGAAIDHGRVHFTGTSELGTLDQNLFVNGSGILIQQPAADLAPVDLRTKNTYAGVYVTDTLELTPDLSLTGGGRFNLARIQLQDQLGTALTGDNTYTRFNPMAGVTYKLRPDLSIYGSYSEANRAPTPLELGCSDPAHPCLIDTFLVSDPALQQVVSRTYEAGLRGRPDQTLSWNAGVFRTDSRNDIINVASPISGFGYFQNAAATRRQGVEAGVAFKRAPWSAYANYSFVDATFQTVLTMSSPFNPAAVNGIIFVMPGSHIPAVPAHRFKAGVDYALSDAWTLGTDLNVTGRQYLVGDASNQNPQVPAYWVMNLHSSYKVTKTIELFGLVQNLFNQHYYAAGAFFDRGAIPFLAFNDPRTLVPGMPLAAYGGVRATF